MVQSNLLKGVRSRCWPVVLWLGTAVCLWASTLLAYTCVERPQLDYNVPALAMYLCVQVGAFVAAGLAVVVGSAFVEVVLWKFGARDAGIAPKLRKRQVWPLYGCSCVGAIGIGIIWLSSAYGDAFMGISRGLMFWMVGQIVLLAVIPIGMVAAIMASRTIRAHVAVLTVLLCCLALLAGVLIAIWVYDLRIPYQWWWLIR